MPRPGSPASHLAREQEASTDSPKLSQERSEEQFSKATGRRRRSERKMPTMNVDGVRSTVQLFSLLYL